LLYRAGVVFDRDSSAREGDDVLIARLASRTARQLGTHGSASVAPSSRPPKRRRPVVMLLAAALVAAGSAAAGTGVAYFVRTEQSVPPAGPRVVLAPAIKGPLRAARREAAAAPSVLEQAPPLPVAPDPLHPAAPAAKRVVAVPLGASALFGEANKRRLAGDSAGAMARYAELAQRYPQSPEANLAELSLGKLYLASGNAERALESFRRAETSGGGLGSEALWGQASALRTLGRTNDERAALERLLAQYPDGAYAKAARKRLGTGAP
jgi:hypothetical protein